MNVIASSVSGVCVAVFGLLVSCAGQASASEPAAKSTVASRQNPESQSRTFQFDYGLKLNQLPAGAKVRVWQPVPQSNEHQRIGELRRNLPAEASVAKESKYGNTILFFETLAPAAGELDFSVSYRVDRDEVQGLSSPSNRPVLSDMHRKLFLKADAKVPVDGKPLELLRGVKLPKQTLAVGQVLYSRVDDHLRYDKSRPGYGNGDSVWACESRFGNCTDFHSLFISLARSQGIPARFEMGFPIPAEHGAGAIGGYHCWAFFFVDGHGWIPVDISEADKQPALKEYYFGNLTADRVLFSTGRDLDLVPKQNSEPLNFFIYPHVEVNGAAWPVERMEKRFAYKDLES